mmetsp:Transcript_52749/g.129428  ORF Transcript_52749/g.129428 Transcript_52749/m.129428 type:complete len:296 (+) Transcript_52749:99-986(+)
MRTVILFSAVILLHLAPTVFGQQCEINFVCFAFDESGSISSSEYEIQRNAILDITKELDSFLMNSVQTQYGAYGWSTSARLVSDFTSLADFITTVSSASRSSGGTNIASGLEACSSAMGSFAGVRILVLLTDGADLFSTDQQLLDLADSIKSDGVRIVTVGIGNGVQAELLEGIASAPEFYISPDDFDGLAGATTEIAEQTCELAGTPSPSASPPEPTNNTCPCSPKPNKTCYTLRPGSTDTCEPVSCTQWSCDEDGTECCKFGEGDIIKSCTDYAGCCSLQPGYKTVLAPGQTC